jgi:nucleotidyltransferase/DNA polymerase involved in DNA repair
MYKLVIVFVCAMLLTACSSAPYYGSESPSVKVAGKHVDLSDTDKVKLILNQQYKDWHGVRYRMGGVSADTTGPAKSG